MRPILLKGHERSITTLKFSHEGDLLWSASKHPTFVVWLCDNGERLGTYHGHNGAIWSLDIDKRTTRVLSASAGLKFFLFFFFHFLKQYSFYNYLIRLLN